MAKSRFVRVSRADAPAAELLLALRDSETEYCSLVDTLIQICNHWNGTPGALHAEAAVKLVEHGYVDAFEVRKGMLGEKRVPIEQERLSALLAGTSPPNVLVRLTGKLSEAQKLLGVSLNTIVRERRDHYIQVLPIFPDAPNARTADVAVLMPFAEQHKPTFDIISAAASKAGLTLGRCDANILSQQIIGEIYQLIRHARIVLADLSGLNANVLYEVGIAHTLGKPCILIANDQTSIPFDVSHLRFVQFPADKPDSLTPNLELMLAEVKAR